ncbi:putative manganese-dependent inorganic diphosphatase [Eubacteriaceae bacterium ES3]|nr:putative manganese-dependent inorganic diphosphatase [Eubacteriaceae bacterium ES3]
MTQKIHVFGHRNPDTDSLCSAIAYANLKNLMGFDNVFPARLGPVNKETQFVLDYFKVDAPELINDVKPQVSDLILSDFSMVSENDSISEAISVILEQPGRSVPVVDEHKKLIGMLSLSDIIHTFTSAFSKTVLRDNKTPYVNLIKLLNADVIGELPDQIVSGSVYTITEIENNQKLNRQDIIVTVGAKEYLDKAFKTEAGVIICSSTDKKILDPLPDYPKGVIFFVDLGPFEVIRLLSQGIPIKNYYQKKQLEYFMTYETIDDVKKNMLTSVHERFPVANEEGEVVAIISKSHLVDFNRKKVILVDHNERSQSIIGINEAEIIEVIDHHRIADIQTASPLYLRIEPVGCTSTIVYKVYQENEVSIPDKIAGLMLSAIISDTLLFNSPTCTNQDKEAAIQLAKQLKLDLNEYGKKMLIAGSNLDTMSPSEILSTDQKIFTMGSYKISISQINTGDFRGIYKKLDAVLGEMNDLGNRENMDLCLLMVTDIILGGTELIIAGQEKRLAQLAFDFSPNEYSKFFNGVFSRKKQIVPPLMNASAI